MNHSYVTEERSDVSRFVIHLTRDVKGPNSQRSTARDNFVSILDECKIRAVNPHCLHGNLVRRLPSLKQKPFRVACFTEVPLNQIRFFVRPIEGRSIKLASYGFVFNKDFLINQGAQPALYINNYGNNTSLREAVDLIWEKAKDKNFKGTFWRLLPYVNIMHGRYDFSWEREWRVASAVHFKLQDLICVIMPPNSDDDKDIRKRLAKSGIPAVSPEWTYERIVTEFAKQQRMTRHFHKGARQKR